jgi:hypothetical protein
MIVTGAALAALAAWAGPAAAQVQGLPVVPIPDLTHSQAVPFEGSSAVANPFDGGPAPPRSPFMAPNPRNNIHDDPYMSDTYRIPGPLGDGAELSTLFSRECGSITFDSAGRIVTVCVGLDRPVLALLDPHSLTTLAAMQLPLRNPASASGVFTDFSGGGYFYLDQRDRAVIPTNDHHVLVVSIQAGPRFSVDHDYDLSSRIPAAEGIVSVLPDWNGLLWFVTRGGLIGTIDRGDGTVRTMRLAGEGISNSFAVDENGGVYVVSDRALYRFDAGAKGAPAISWRVAYPNSGIHKPGQSDAGSGTTPTLMGGKWVAITDNADPMNVDVYRRAVRLPKKHRKRKKGKARAKAKAKARLVCSAPVFAKGASATDNSLIGTDRSLIAENNYGYTVGAANLGGTPSSPGLTRIDVVKKKVGKKKRKRRRKVRFRCRTAWTSDEIAPSVVPKLSLANGLVYTYTKPRRTDGIDAWYLTALDFRTGRTIYRRLAGTGFGFNNNYAPVTLGPDGTAYVGVLGGLVELP